MQNKIIAFIMCCLLSGCSFTFVYNNLDWWAGWYIDDYIDFNEQQNEHYQQAFTQFHQWHRKTQLPLYRKTLLDIKAQINQGITIEQFEQHRKSMWGYWLSIKQEAYDDLAYLASTLTKQQKESFIIAIKEQSEERAKKYRKLSQHEREEKRCENQKDQFKEWLGKLTKKQKQTLCEYSKELHSTTEERITYRMSLLNLLSTSFEIDHLSNEFKHQFTTLIITPENLKPELLIEQEIKNRLIYFKSYQYMFNNLTSKQKKKLNKKLDYYIENLTDLIADMP